MTPAPVIHSGQVINKGPITLSGICVEKKSKRKGFWIFSSTQYWLTIKLSQESLEELLSKKPHNIYGNKVEIKNPIKLCVPTQKYQEIIENSPLLLSAVVSRPDEQFFLGHDPVTILDVMKQ